MALSPSGDYVVSSSHDKSLRLWERTREVLILEEEREMVREPPWYAHSLTPKSLEEELFFFSPPKCHSLYNKFINTDKYQNM